MQLHLTSKFHTAESIIALDTDGYEHLVTVVKASWQIPQPGQRPIPIEPQPIEATDRYLGDPGLSAMIYGSDLVRFKPRCDILLDACAHSPDGRDITTLIAAFQVGTIKKGVQVTGPRQWHRTLGITTLSSPQPFRTLPLHYGMAFGGSRTYEKGIGSQKQTLSDALLQNPAGLGYASKHTIHTIDQQPAPSLEPIGYPITSPSQQQAPIAFSAIGRHWHPRATLSGTYDEQWRRDVFPLLPKDYDEHFNQCAPADQQCDYLQGGEDVVLKNMMAGRPDVRFKLPALSDMLVRVLRKDLSHETLTPVVDTLFFETEHERFSIVWRTSVRLKRGIQEIDSIAVGPIAPPWWDAKTQGLDGGNCANCGDSTPADAPYTATL